MGSWFRNRQTSEANSKGEPNAASAIPLQRLHRDPVEVPARQADQLSGLGTACVGDRGRRNTTHADPGARARPFFLAYLAQQFVERLLRPLRCLEWLQPGQQQIENHPQRVDLGTSVDVYKSGSVCSGLIYPGDPAKSRACVRGLSSAIGGVAAVTSPKSMIRGVGLPSTSTTRMFGGFRSRG
jgi:hypothetical protein